MHIGTWISTSGNVCVCNSSLLDKTGRSMQVDAETVFFPVSPTSSSPLSSLRSLRVLCRLEEGTSDDKTAQVRKSKVLATG
jgi:hypothetical protein